MPSKYEDWVQILRTHIKLPGYHASVIQHSHREMNLGNVGTREFPEACRPASLASKVTYGPTFKSYPLTSTCALVYIQAHIVKIN